MEKINTGIVNLIISDSLKKSYFNESLIEESKKLANSYFDIVKKSKILQLEFKVFDNIQNKHIENESEARRYIDNNIKLFQTFTNEEIEEEHDKLTKFINENNLSVGDDLEIKVNLYNAINNLIKESLNEPTSVDVDEMHESFLKVLNHVKKPKKVIVENNEMNGVNDTVIEIAIDKFNDRYNKLNEDDRNLLSNLINSNSDEKTELLKEYKKDVLNLLNDIGDEVDKQKIENTKKKINEMNESVDDINDNIIDLHELKKGLI